MVKLYSDKINEKPEIGDEISLVKCLHLSKDSNADVFGFMNRKNKYICMPKDPIFWHMFGYYQLKAKDNNDSLFYEISLFKTNKKNDLKEISPEKMINKKFVYLGIGPLSYP